MKTGLGVIFLYTLFQEEWQTGDLGDTIDDRIELVVNHRTPSVSVMTDGLKKGITGDDKEVSECSKEIISEIEYKWGNLVKINGWTQSSNGSIPIYFPKKFFKQEEKRYYNEYKSIISVVMK